MSDTPRLSAFATFARDLARELDETDKARADWKRCAIRLASCCRGESIELRRVALEEFDRLMREDGARLAKLSLPHE